MLSRPLFVVAMLAFPLGACGGESDSGCSSRDDLFVLAASSLAVVEEDMRTSFASIEPCVDITFSFGSSGTLASQVVSGVPADVFLSAGKKATDQVVGARLVSHGPTDFARNSIAIMVSAKSKFVDAISELLDLSDDRNPGVVVGLCDQNAPCGQLVDKVFTNAAAAGIQVSRSSVADTEANSVESLVTKIELGEIDAGFVYSSDCAATTRERDVRCVSVPEVANGRKLNEFTTYSAMALNADTISAHFVDMVGGKEFMSTLIEKFGFSG